jgi:hypothetical protein
MGWETWRSGRECSILKEAMLGSYGRFSSWCLVPVAERDLGCGDGMFGGEVALQRAKLDPAGEIVK